MIFELVKNKNFSGDKASVYCVLNCEDEKILFEKFVEENLNSFKSELLDILKRLNSIKNVGAKEHFFKKAEGTLGDGVEALYDTPKSNLRLYCIRYGSSLIVLGGGGHKPKTIRALQESSKLKAENYLLREISQRISERIKQKEIWFSNDGKDFKGNLIFKNDDE